MTAIMLLNKKAEALAIKMKPGFYLLYTMFNATGAFWKTFPFVSFLMYLMLVTTFGTIFEPEQMNKYLHYQMGNDLTDDGMQLASDGAKMLGQGNLDNAGQALLVGVGIGSFIVIASTIADLLGLVLLPFAAIIKTGFSITDALLAVASISVLKWIAGLLFAFVKMLMKANQGQSSF